MKRIGVIADTHLSEEEEHRLPDAVVEAFEGVDMILHAGDIGAPWVLEELEKIAPVYAIIGNNDDPALFPDLPTERRVEVEGCVIGMTHGDTMIEPRIMPFRDATGNWQQAVNALSHYRFDESVNCIIYGHSHFPLVYICEVRQQGAAHSRSVLLLNPGSPTDKRKAPYCGCAILLVSGTKTNARIVEIHPPQ